MAFSLSVELPLGAIAIHCTKVPLYSLLAGMVIVYISISPVVSWSICQSPYMEGDRLLKNVPFTFHVTDGAFLVPHVNTTSLPTKPTILIGGITISESKVENIIEKA